MHVVPVHILRVLLLCMAVFGAAISARAQLSVSPLSVFRSSETAGVMAHAVQITVTTSASWSVANSYPWFSVSPTSGTGSASLSITFTQNTGVTARGGSFTIVSGTSSQVVNVAQSGAPASLSLSSNSVSTSASAGAVGVLVSSNTGWTVNTNGASWITPSMQQGNDTQLLMFSLALNPGIELRSATISITSTTGSLTQSYVINQQGVQISLSVNPASLSQSAALGAGQVNVTSNTSWTASANQAWITINPSSGTGNGSFAYTIAENTQTASRSGVITVSAASTTSTILVNQSGAAPSLTVEPAFINPSAAGIMGQASVVSNTTWSVSADQPWITINPTSGSGNGNFGYTIAENTQTSSRSGVITVSGGNMVKTIAVTQQGVPLLLNISPLSITTSASAGVTSFGINSNTLWTINTNGVSWVSPSIFQGSGTQPVVLSFATNTSILPRSATFTISIGSQTQTLSIIQQGAPASLTVTPTTFTSPAAGLYHNYGVQVQATAGLQWTATSNQSWLLVNATTGIGNGNGQALGFTTQTNPSASSRSGVITVVGSGLTQIVTVTQPGTTATLTVDTQSLNPSANGATGQVQITANTTWTASTDQSWLMLSPISGTGNGSFSYTAAANSSNSPREATITVTDGTNTRTIAVIQAGTIKIISSPAGGTQPADFTYTKGRNWGVANSLSFVDVTPKSGSGDGSVSVKVQANNTMSDRTGVIYITGSVGNLASSATITISTIVVEQSGVKTPTISSFTPASGHPGAKVTITGTNFYGLTSVKLAGNEVPHFVVESSTTISVVLGAGNSGVFSITNTAGTAVSAQQFTYEKYQSQTLPPVNVYSNAQTSLSGISDNLPKPKNSKFNFTVVSTSANGSLVKNSGAKSAYALILADKNADKNADKKADIQAENVLGVGDSFSYDELSSGKIVFKPVMSAKGTTNVQFSAPAGALGDEALLVTAQFSLTTSVAGKFGEPLRVVAYPNPTVDYLTIESNGDYREIPEISVYSATGTQLLSVKADNFGHSIKKTLDLRDFPTGAYFIEIGKAGESSRMRVVKQR